MNLNDIFPQTVLGYIKNFICYIKPWQDELLLAAVCLSILLIVHEMLKFVSKLIPHRKKAGRVKKAGETGDIKKYYPVLTGALIGYSVMNQYPVWAVVSCVTGGLLGFLGRKFYIWFYRKLMEEKKAGEVLILYEIISVFSSSGYSIYEALSVGTYLMDSIRKPLEKCLRRWGYGPERALEKMGKEIGIPEAEALAKILQRATKIGPDKLASFLSQESETMEKLRQYRIERGLGVRPLIQTIYLILPGAALFGVTVFPIGYHIAQTIQSIKLN